MADDIPLQMSVRQPGYDAQLGAAIEILLDGVVQDRLIAYDMVEGTVLRHRVDAGGRLVRPLVEETLRGRVEVRWKLSNG